MASIRALKVISGGQDGVDQIALELALAKKLLLIGRGHREDQLQVGGWMPKGWRTIDRPRPEFAQRYGMRECPVDGYPARTAMNVRDCHLTIWFGEDSPGKLCTMRACKALNRSVVTGTRIRTPESVLRLLRLEATGLAGDEGPMVLNVAGTRYRDSPGGKDAAVFIAAFLDWYTLWV